MINKKSFAIYLAGLLQGVTLVAFPAASTILTNPHQFDLSGTAYGGLFIPQAILSIGASAFNPMLIKRFSSKFIFLIGILFNLISMVLLASSVILMHSKSLSYITLLLATGCLGLGFGLTVPTINGVAALLHPAKIDSVLLALNALLGVGTALAPIFISAFVAIGFWWGLPVILSILLCILFLVCLPLTLPKGKLEIASTSRSHVPSRFWIFALFALLYGVVETLNGNWVSIYVSEYVHASMRMQSFALSAFWGMLTFGRIFYAATGKIIREELVFQISPFICCAAFIFVAFLSSGADLPTLFAFGLTGFGCSALLPLIISFGSRQLKVIAPSVPGMVISFYLLGYGIAAFGVGPLQDSAHISLRTVYGMGAMIALFMGIISFFIVPTKNNRIAWR